MTDQRSNCTRIAAAASGLPWHPKVCAFAAMLVAAELAFVIGTCARRMVVWRVSYIAQAGFVLDALEQALRPVQPAVATTD